MSLPSAHEIEARLRIASDMSDLSAESRLEAKLDMSPNGIRDRLLEASELLETCHKLAVLGRESR